MNFDIYLSFFNNYLYFCISFPFFINLQQIMK